MSKRQDYLEHGLQKIEFNYDRVLIATPGRLMTDTERSDRGENGAIPSNVAAALGLEKTPLPEGTRITKYRENPEYDHAKEIATAAQRLHLEIAPTVTVEDMPQHLQGNDRLRLLDYFSSTGLNLPKVSLYALQHELTEEQFYWGKARNDCFPIIDKQAERLRTRTDSQSEKGLKCINEFRKFLTDKSKDPNSPMGEIEFTDKMLGAMAAGQEDYTKEEMEVFASHYVANSRIGNLYGRQFAKVTQNLPEEAYPVVDMVQSGNGEPQIMWHIEKRASMETGDFIKHSQEQQSEIVQTISEEVDSSLDATKQDRIKAKACKQLSEETVKESQKPHDTLEQLGKVNRAILSMYPYDEPGHIRILIGEVARTKVTEREALISSVVKKENHDVR